MHEAPKIPQTLGEESTCEHVNPPARAINLHNFKMEGRTGRAQVHNSPQQVEIPHRGPESTEIMGWCCPERLRPKDHRAIELAVLANRGNGLVYKIIIF